MRIKAEGVRAGWSRQCQRESNKRFIMVPSTDSGFMPSKTPSIDPQGNTMLLHHWP